MNKKVFDDFVDAINEHNVEKLHSLMTEDHKFIDSYGNEVSGKDKMRSGWIEYFHWFPDYNIEITDLFIENNTIAAFGFAGGSFQGRKYNYLENYFRIPAAWKVTIENDKIKLWQVYADTKKQLDIIERNK
jgi:ketosteroid isomerase-like protein